MYRSLLATLAATMVLWTAPIAAPLHATSAILRCQSPNGALVYTDKACSAFGAKAAPIPGALLTRIYHDEARFGGSTDIPVSAALSPIAGRRRDANRGCARTPTQLAMDLRGSLAMGDVNRVAESYHWVGMSSRQGERTLDRLQALVGKPVLDSHYFDAQIGMGDAGASGDMLASTARSVGGDAGMLQLVLADDDDRAAVDFDVHKFAGCYFVTF